MSIKKKATHGSVWTSITRMGINVVDFAVYAFLARMLTLEEFGLLGVCFLIVEFANTLVNVGINQNIVQRNEWSDRYASSTFVFIFGIALCVVTLLGVIGVPVAYLTFSEEAALVILSLTPITLITSVQAVFSGKLLREFKNKEMGTAKFVASVISGSIIIILALNGFGIWSLVIGKLINAILQAVFLIYLSSFIPSLSINRADSRELINFCLPLLWSAVLSFCHKKSTNIFTGLALGPVSFALLTASQKGQQMLTQITMGSINTMVVPSFSRVEDKSQLGNLYIKLVTVTSTLVLPIFMGLAAIADPFVTVAFGNKFAPSADYMIISAFVMYSAVINWFLPNLMVSTANTKESFKLNLISVITNIAVAGTTIWFGLEIMLISIVISSFLITPIRYKIVTKHLPIDALALARSLVPSFFSAFAMFIILLLIKDFLKDNLANDYLLLATLIMSGACIYPLVLFTLFYQHSIKQLNELKGMFLKKNKSNKLANN